MRRRLPTLARLMAMLLAMLLSPGWAEVLEGVEHLAFDGHLPHGAAHVAEAPGDHDLPSHTEAACTPVAHHCGCCASLAAAPTGIPTLDAVPVLLPPALPAPAPAGRPLEGALAPPFRPPIA